jgi:hypothetical protein
MPEISVSRKGVAKLLSNINPNKACGPDKIPLKILKDCSDSTSLVLHISAVVKILKDCSDSTSLVLHISAVA